MELLAVLVPRVATSNLPEGPIASIAKQEGTNQKNKRASVSIAVVGAQMTKAHVQKRVSIARRVNINQSMERQFVSIAFEESTQRRALVLVVVSIAK